MKKLSLLFLLLACVIVIGTTSVRAETNEVWDSLKSICDYLGLIWEAETKTCTIQENQEVYLFGEILTIKEEESLVVQGGLSIRESSIVNNQGTILNDGTFENLDGTFKNYGTIDNDSTIFNQGYISNGDSGSGVGVINNHDSGTITNDGTFDNWCSSTMSNYGAIVNHVYFSSCGTVDNHDYIVNDSNLYNYGTFINNGYMYQPAPISRLSNFGVIKNRGWIDNWGDIQNHDTIYNLCMGFISPFPPINRESGQVFYLNNCVCMPLLADSEP